MTQSLLIAQCFVYGDSFKSYLVAIIVPDEEVVTKWSRDHEDKSICGLSFEALCKSQPLRDTIMDEVKNLSHRNQLYGFETPKVIFLEPHPFSVENTFLTPTFKLKRQQLRDHYARQIDSMYAELLTLPSKL
jgi:long-chain acyl-CoA synthetase